MTTYISKEAKNGKMQYFRVNEDGKKKMIKREEYEANVAKEPITFCEMHKPSGCHECPNRSVCQNSDETATTETNETITPFDFVKSTVGETAGRHKLTFKDWEKYASVYYRSAAICGYFHALMCTDIAITNWTTATAAMDSPQQAYYQFIAK